MVDINNITRVTDDSEMSMAKSDLYNLAKNSVELFKLIKDLPELEGWTQAKITKAADYIGSVLNYMKYEAHEQRMDISEMASSGGTSSGAIATAPMPMGKKKVIKRESMGAYDKEAGAKHTRESLIKKLEALPKGDDKFEHHRWWAIEQLKKGKMLFAKYHMAQMKRNEPKIEAAKK